MKKKVWVIGGIATAVVLAGGWAFAQSRPHGPGGFGPPFMHGQGGMGPGMMQHMHGGMGGGMGPDMMQHMGQGMGAGMHPGMGPGGGPGMMHGAAGPTFADPAQIERLKGELAITPAQEPAWSKYAKTIQDAATAMKTTREGVDPDALSKMTPADRFAFVTKMREQGQKRLESVKTAAEELLATLDDTQKARARDILPGLAAFGAGMRDAMAGPQHRH